MKITENQFQAQVIELAQLLGYRVAHFRPAQTTKGWRTPVAADGAGFPDLVISGRGRVVFLELKTDTGKLSADQHAWIDSLTANGAEAHIARPSGWLALQTLLTQRST